MHTIPILSCILALFSAFAIYLAFRWEKRRFASIEELCKSQVLSQLTELIKKIDSLQSFPLATSGDVSDQALPGVLEVLCLTPSPVGSVPSLPISVQKSGESSIQFGRSELIEAIQVTVQQSLESHIEAFRRFQDELFARSIAKSSPEAIEQGLNATPDATVPGISETREELDEISLNMTPAKESQTAAILAEGLMSFDHCSKSRKEIMEKLSEVACKSRNLESVSDARFATWLTKCEAIESGLASKLDELLTSLTNVRTNQSSMISKLDSESSNIRSGVEKICERTEILARAQLHDLMVGAFKQQHDLFVPNVLSSIAPLTTMAEKINSKTQEIFRHQSELNSTNSKHFRDLSLTLAEVATRARNLESESLDERFSKWVSECCKNTKSIESGLNLKLDNLSESITFVRSNHSSLMTDLNSQSAKRINEQTQEILGCQSEVNSTNTKLFEGFSLLLAEIAMKARILEPESLDQRFSKWVNECNNYSRLFESALNVKLDRLSEGITTVGSNHHVMMTDLNSELAKITNEQTHQILGHNSELNATNAMLLDKLSLTLTEVATKARNLESESLDTRFNTWIANCINDTRLEFKTAHSEIQSKSNNELKSFFERCAEPLKSSHVLVSEAEAILSKVQNDKNLLKEESQKLNDRELNCTERQQQLKIQFSEVQKQRDEINGMILERDRAVAETQYLVNLKQQFETLQKPAILEDVRLTGELKVLSHDTAENRLIMGAVYQFDACLHAVRKSEDIDSLLSLQESIYSLSRALFRQSSKHKADKRVAVSVWCESTASLTQKWFEMRLPILGRPIDWEWMSSSSSGVVREVNSWAVLSKVNGILIRKAEVK